ncbi:oligosaccharide flippase family protein [Candidatus Saccharibacteria bacterium]|nr:oligosaccharide flippase family protein [Candidatus Saccharibacteria bacterium]
MGKNKELVKNTAILSLGRFSTQLISFILMPLFTYFLSTSDYGYIDLIQTYIALVAPIIIFRLDAGLFRFLIDNRRKSKDQEIIISNVLLFSFVQVLFFAFIFLIVAFLININLALPIVINAVSFIFSNLMLQIARGIGDNKKYSIASILAGVATLVVSIVLVCVAGIGGAGVLLGSASGNILCFIYLLIVLQTRRKIKRSNINKGYLKRILKYSIPMVPDGLSWWVLGVSDRTIISLLIGTAANGVYAVSSKFSNILSSIFQVFNMSWQESASLHINDKDRDEFFSGVLNTTYKLFYTICLLILGVMPFIFIVLIDQSYHDAYIYAPILLCGNLVNAIANITGAVYIAKKKTKIAARTTIVAAVINIVVNLLLVNQFGLYAAAISTLVAYSFLAVFRYFDIKKYVNMRLNVKLFIISILVYIICSIVYWQQNIIFSVVNLLVIVVFCLLLNRSLIRGGINLLLHKKKK